MRVRKGWGHSSPARKGGAFWPRRGKTMAGQKRRSPPVTEQGVPLIELVIERVRADPYCISGFCGDRPLKAAQPFPAETLERLTFPSGKPLAPSLKRWLAFDGTWLRDLGWFSPLEQAVFTPRRLDEIVEDEFAMWGECY